LYEIYFWYPKIKQKSSEPIQGIEEIIRFLTPWLVYDAQPFIDNKGENIPSQIKVIEHVTIPFVYPASKEKQIYELFVRKIPAHNHFS